MATGLTDHVWTGRLKYARLKKAACLEEKILAVVFFFDHATIIALELISANILLWFLKKNELGLLNENAI